MISIDDVALVGKVNKTHGVRGELLVSFEHPDVADSISAGSCVVMDVDGIFTPFFVAAVRPRGNQSLLLTIDGIDSQEAAQAYVGREVYMPIEDMPEFDMEDAPEDGMYASDLCGFMAYDTEGKELGKIIDIDDSTENELFILESPDSTIIYIPITDEFITEINEKENKITFDLPEGLLSL
ncbi:MAG: ribosome maturation factor RimM [Bacteroidales bacterium]|nr:ribosome maturation factor RimM [Bacteroidales bacterium]